MPDPVHHLDPSAPFKYGTSWDWRKARRGEWFRTCNYCGSIHPEDLALKLAAQGPCQVCGEVGWEACFRARPMGTEQHVYDPGSPYASWADQKYGWPHKFYVEGLKPKDPKLLRYMGSSSGGDGQPPSWGGPDAIWVRDDQLTMAQRRILIADGALRPREKRDGTWFCLAPKDTLHAKFYTAHLADPAISDEVKEKIYVASGLRFHFTEAGGVRWHTSMLTCEEVHPS